MKKDKKPKLQESREEISALKNQLARALADYANLQKRSEEEKIFWVSFASQRIIGRLLPILDMIESGVEHTKDQGLAIAAVEFKNLLKEEGLGEISPSLGAEFDHDIMEAIDTSPTDEENMDGKIESVSMRGWKYKDGKVLRHAKVKVYKKEK